MFRKKVLEQKLKFRNQKNISTIILNAHDQHWYLNFIKTGLEIFD